MSHQRDRDLLEESGYQSRLAVDRDHPGSQGEAVALRSHPEVAADQGLLEVAVGYRSHPAEEVVVDSSSVAVVGHLVD